MERIKGKVKVDGNAYLRPDSPYKDCSKVVATSCHINGFPAEQQIAHIEHLAKCWNAFEEGGLVSELVAVAGPLLEGYCNMAQMLQTDMQFQGDQLTQRAEQAIAEAKEGLK